MRAKKFVTAAALVALLTGGAAFAADSRTAGDAGPTAKSGSTDPFQNDDEGRKVARFRARWDQIRGQAPSQGDRLPDSCTDNPLARLFADVFGFEDIVRPCEGND